jgi:hypothetical protein
VTKVQGALGRLLPTGKVEAAFPADAILQYTGHLSADSGNEQDETTIAEAGARRELLAEPERGQPPSAGGRLVERRSAPSPISAFYAQAKQLGYETPEGDLDRNRIQRVLGAHGYHAFNVARATQMLDLLERARHERP